MTGVDSDPKLATIRSLGADHTIDYAREDFTKNGFRYDLILDLVASRSVVACRRALSARGMYVMIGGSTGTILQVATLGALVSKAGEKKLKVLAHRPSAADLAYMNEQCEAGNVSPVVDRSYPLSKVAEALRYFGEGNTKGKIVITVSTP